MTDPKTKTGELEGLTFEKALQELEKIVYQLENEQLNLDESLGLFERGQILGNHCARILEEAELKITRLAPGATDMETQG